MAKSPRQTQVWQQQDLFRRGSRGVVQCPGRGGEPLLQKRLASLGLKPGCGIFFCLQGQE